MKSPVSKVTRNVGVNPVARAVAHQRLNQAVVDARIAMHLLDEGQDCLEVLGMVPIMVRATLHALSTNAADVDYRKMLSADAIMGEIMERGTWRKVDRVTLDNAMDIVLRRWPALPPNEASKALEYATKELTS